MAQLEKMTDLLRHRGPDDFGYFRNEYIGMGHRRLSILDLSEAGRQPMENEDGSLRLICNGEIYNYREKTAELKNRGHRFRSRSDCEVLLHLYEEYGIEFLTHVNGMFAFILWDEKSNRILAAVDRFGKKPLYYASFGDRLAFASELKSLLIFPWLRREIDPLAIDRYLSLRYIPAPLTIYKSIRKMEMATLMVCEGGRCSIRKYWSPETYDAPTSSSRFEDLLKDSIELRMQSDVPLGIYLSGGVDSAAVAAIMNRDMGESQKVSYTVSIDYAHDEHNRAQAVAGHLGFEYNRVGVNPADFGLMPRIQWHMDEPFGDLLSLPSFLLAKNAKEKLTVVLTGDGADEILSGYFHQRIMYIRERKKRILQLPGMERLLAGAIRSIPSSTLNLFFDYPDKLGPREKRKLGQSMEKCGNFGAFYEGITSCFTPEDKSGLYSDSFSKQVSFSPLCEEYQKALEQANGFSFLSRLSQLDLKYWIPFSVLYRLDKMNMAHAVETRSPFLDYRVVEACLNLPETEKNARGMNKIALRRLIRKLYPAALREPGKQAFYMPVTGHYREQYFSWLSPLIEKKRVEARGFFNWPFIEQIYQDARNGSMLATRQLTSLAMLEQWFDVFNDALPEKV